MSQNISLWGANYSNVPSVELPKQGGGTASFTDVSDTTAAASDVASGKYFYTSAGVKTAGTASGGGGVDIPTFTVLWNDSWTAVTSVTCDKTYNEAKALYQAYPDAMMAALVIDTDQYDEEHPTSAASATEYTNYMLYTVVSGTLPTADIQYNSNGTIQYIQPSGSYTSLSATANGTYTPPSGKAYNSVTVSVSGGVSNVVIGEFTTSSSSGVHSVTIPYTGSGFPTAAMVFVEGGAYNNSDANATTWYNRVQRYAVGQWTYSKRFQYTTPDYGASDTKNQGVTTAIYKNSTSQSTSYTRTSAMSTLVLTSTDPSAAAVEVIKFSSKTTMKYYTASSSYGLLGNLKYTYIIVYSS